MSAHPAPPRTASQTYTSLHTTALAFISAQSQDPTHPSRMNFTRISALCAPDFQHSWGHNYAVAQNPRIQGTLSFELFVAHLESMLPALESWDAVVTDVTVDEVQRKVVLRVSFGMVVKGSGEVVENDLMWVLEMDEEGRVWRSREFVDGSAAGRMKELMMMSVKK
jgi:ketosteroid isomerase-like protein